MATRKTSTASADFVTVACKLPQGLHIMLDGQREPLKLHGSQSPYARFGHGMTQVRADTWEQVEKQYGERDGVDHNGRPCTLPRAAWLESGAVFAHNKPQSTNDMSKERQDVRAGFERIDRKKPNEVPGIGAMIQEEGKSDPGMPD